MKIAIVKPDYNVIGGFEIVMDRIKIGLEDRGHMVEYIKVDMTQPRFQLGNITIPPEIYYEDQEFFKYMMSIQDFNSLYLDEFDIALTTQPPSFAVRHPNIVALFYHHNKLYYELRDVYIECGMADETRHRKGAEIVREIDSYYLTDEINYAAGSGHVANRLRKYNNIEKDIFIFAAGIDDDFYSYDGDITYDGPMYIGRHEFPKRPELFLHAMKHVEGLTGKVIGQGGKTEDLKKMDRYLSYIHRKGQDIDDEHLWKKAMFEIDKLINRKIERESSNVVFTGRISKEQLIAEYASSLCVVCPAFEEDYGLTAIEAMAFKKPVIVCDDGGGLVEFIEDGVNGFVVEPTGKAIAEAIEYLQKNPKELKRMGENAYECSRKYSWENAIDSFCDYIETCIK